jgi:hypothetical protein
MQTLWQDLRYGARMLLKNPGFTLIAVATLSLGIGANTAIFSVLHGVLLKPLPYPDPDPIIRVWQAVPASGFARLGFSEAQLTRLRAGNQSLALVIAAGLLLRSFDRLLRIDPGFNVENLLTVNVNLPASRYQDIARVTAFYDQLLERVRAAPGVVAAAAASGLPLTDASGDTVFQIEGRPDNNGVINQVRLTAAPTGISTTGR